MYNDTCSRYEIMMQNKPEAKDKWIRTCPKDVKSCFWAQGDGSPKENGWYLGNGNNAFYTNNSFILLNKYRKSL